jgi:hypothetical protein
VERNGVDVAPAIAALIVDGFGPRKDGEDLFDAIVGLLGMLDVVMGGRPSGEPDDPIVHSLEGWILGQASEVPA